MILEVKGGANVNINALRALRGVLEADDALLAGLIVMKPLGDRQARNFRQFMAEAGDLQVGDTLYPRLQILSIPEILDSKRFNTYRQSARFQSNVPRALNRKKPALLPCIGKQASQSRCARIWP